MDFGLHEDGTTLAKFLAAMDSRDGKCKRHCNVDGALEMCHAEDASPPVNDAQCTNDPLYIFASVDEGDDNATRKRDGILADFPSHLPEFLGGATADHVRIRSRQFYLGPEGSGAPQHVHSDAYNAIAYGAKRWFLSPPHSSNYTRIHPSRFVRDVLPRLSADERPIECVQLAGDVLYVPFLWGHAVLNIHETIGIAMEFSYRGNFLDADRDF